MENSLTARCCQCGSVLTPQNATKAPNGWCEATGYAYFCVTCQQKYFDNLISENIKLKLAYYICCIAFNVPFVPSEMAKRKGTNLWTKYLENISSAENELLQDGSIAGFLDGITTLKDLSSEETDNHYGVASQRRTWGTGPKTSPYTEQEYDALDSYYNAYAGRLERGGGPDEQQEHILRLCAKCMVEIDRAMSLGKPDVVQKYNKIIQDNLASENLRKKDVKPIDDMRVDTLVDALEKRGYMKDGKLLDYDELLEKLRGDTPKYRYTRDAADQMLLAIINTMRANEGYSQYMELPIGYRIVDNNNEFAESPNKKEIEAYDKLGLVREGVDRSVGMIKKKPSRIKRGKKKIEPKTKSNGSNAITETNSEKTGGDE